MKKRFSFLRMKIGFHGNKALSIAGKCLVLFDGTNVPE